MRIRLPWRELLPLAVLNTLRASHHGILPAPAAIGPMHALSQRLADAYSASY